MSERIPSPLPDPDPDAGPDPDPDADPDPDPEPLKDEGNGEMLVTGKLTAIEVGINASEDVTISTLVGVTTSMLVIVKDLVALKSRDSKD